MHEVNPQPLEKHSFETKTNNAHTRAHLHKYNKATHIGFIKQVLISFAIKFTSNTIVLTYRRHIYW